MKRMAPPYARRVKRRTVLTTGLAWGALGVASSFPIRTRAEEPVKMGMVEPLSGVYAALAAAEVEGARLALEEVNHSGGIVGRQVQLLVEDSANDIALGVAKTRQLIDRDHVDFIFGNVNSAVALAMTRVTAEKRKLHIVTGGHVDDITGSRCSWNVFRICKTTTMEPTRMATARLCERLI
jgi:branched-chain amino acid transport system substrate-binding protein